MKRLLAELHENFKITYSSAECFVGIQIEKDEDAGIVKLHQSAYCKKIPERFNFINSAPVSTSADPGINFTCVNNKTGNKSVFPYREAVGSLMYLMIRTRPGLAYIVGILSRYMGNPTDIHWNGIERVFKYLRGTMSEGITFYLNSNDTRLISYSDADWARDVDTRRSTTGWICFLNSGPISWSSRKQTVTATSTTEAEFVALC